MEEEISHVVYSKNVIEFVTVSKEFCQLLQNTQDISKKDFVGVLIKILPLLYLKSTTLPKVESILNDPLEKTVTEEEYEMILQTITFKLGAHNDYLEVFTPDIERSEGALAASIAEDLSDIYQDLTDFLTSFKIGVTEIMNDALYEVVSNFELYWGQRLVNTLRACHNVFYGDDDLGEEEDTEITPQGEDQDENGDNFYNRFQQQWRDEDDV